MNPPNLGEVSYFRIPPSVTFSELEIKLAEINLNSEPEVRKAIDLVQKYHLRQERESGALVLEEHLYPVTMLSIEHELHQGKCFMATKEFVASALLHDILDDTAITLDEFNRLLSAPVSKIVSSLSDSIYGRNLSYEERTQLKFGNLKDKRQAGIIALADRINNLLCMYAKPFIEEDGIPTLLLLRRVTIAENIVKPFAESISPHFFGIMLTEVIEYYKSKYPFSFAHYKDLPK